MAGAAQRRGVAVFRATPSPLLSAALLVCALPRALSDSCTALNSCSNRGVCDTVNSKCICFNGFGSPSDIALYKAPDCSARTCPADTAWVDVPTGATTAHALAECSNMGLCDTVLGRCKCFAGYEGEACQRCACRAPSARGRAPRVVCRARRPRRARRRHTLLPVV